MKRFLRKFVVSPIFFIGTISFVLTFEFLEWMFTKEEDRWNLWTPYIDMLFGDPDEPKVKSPAKRLPTTKDLKNIRKLLLKHSSDEVLQDSFIASYLKKHNIDSVGIGRVDGVRFTTLRG